MTDVYLILLGVLIAVSYIILSFLFIPIGLILIMFLYFVPPIIILGNVVVGILSFKYLINWKNICKQKRRIQTNILLELVKYGSVSLASLMMLHDDPISKFDLLTSELIVITSLISYFVSLISYVTIIQCNTSD